MINITTLEDCGMVTVRDAEEYKEFYEDFLAEDNKDWDNAVYQLLDDSGLLGNGWTIIPPEAIGALTAGLLISEDISIEDDGEYSMAPGGVILWDAQYAVSDMLEQLFVQGYYFLTKEVYENGF